MRLEFAFLCDAATETNGRINALGMGIDRLNASQVPVVHNRLMLVARIAYTHDDEGNHPFAIRLADADGQEIGKPVSGNLNLKLGADSMFARANLLVDLVKIEFKTYGPHEVVVAIDGEEFVNLPLEVART